MSVAANSRTAEGGRAACTIPAVHARGRGADAPHQQRRPNRRAIRSRFAHALRRRHVVEMENGKQKKPRSGRRRPRLSVKLPLVTDYLSLLTGQELAPWPDTARLL